MRAPSPLADDLAHDRADDRHRRYSRQVMDIAPPMPVDLTAPAAAELRHYRGDHGRHAHAHAQLLFGIGGCLDVEVGGHLMRVDAVTGLIVPAGALHGSASRDGADVWVLDAPAAACGRWHWPVGGPTA
jgi:hypothetical protein